MRARIRAICALLALGSVVACNDQLTEPSRSVAPAAAVLDGAHAGTAYFFFLPPMVPPPSFSGTFDFTLSPVVTICALAGSSCGATVATFSGSQVQLLRDDPAYRAIWKTKGVGLDAETTYRIQVSVGSVLLGYADARVLNKGNTVNIVDQGQTIATVTGGSLPIRFRIETVPPPPPTVWNDGDLITFDQVSWGAPNDLRGHVLGVNYNRLYGAAGFLQVGVPGAGGNSLLLTSSNAIATYLPAQGSSGALTTDLVDPSTTGAGAFAGEVVALALNVDYADAHAVGAGLTPDSQKVTTLRFGASAVPFGDLVLCGLGPLPGFPVRSFDGLRVREVLASANDALGGALSLYAISDLDAIAAQLNASFLYGAPDTFAQQHLALAGCQPKSWKNGDAVTLTQGAWATNPAVHLLDVAFGFVYAATSYVEIGIPGQSGFSTLFTSPSAVTFYLPGQGALGALTADLVDPGSTPSGGFGGEVLALQFNVDFSDAGRIIGATNTKFGDLTLCHFAPLPGPFGGTFNGLTVRQFLASANNALGGGLSVYSISDLFPVAEQLNQSFAGGAVTQFARDHLVKGACS